MSVFATVADYQLRYGAAADQLRLKALLGDASALIAGMPGFDCSAKDEAWWANLKRITCAVVHRSLVAGDLAGMQTYSETGIGYSASATPFNPGGDLYLTKAEKRTLGIGGVSFGAILPEIGRGCARGQDAGRTASCG